jgi:hypothetical protein
MHENEGRSRTSPHQELPSLPEDRPTSNLPTLFHAICALRHLSPELWWRWLESHAPALSGAGLALEALGDYRALLVHRDELPLPVLDSIDYLHRLSDETGAELLVAAFAQAGRRTGPVGRPIELAVRALLDHRSVFFSALDQRHVRWPSFQYLAGRAPVAPRWSPAELQRLSRRLGKVFEDRGGCRVLAWMERALVHFLVRRTGFVQSGYDARGERVLSVPLQGVREDLVVLDARTGHLRIGPCDHGYRSAYIAAFGELVADDPTWFQHARLIRLERLAELGQGVLTPTRGLISVRLDEIVLASSGVPGGLQVERGWRTHAVLDELKSRPSRGRRPRSVTFSLQPAADGRHRPVTVHAPDAVECSWRLASLAQRFLEEHGLLSAEPSAC